MIQKHGDWKKEMYYTEKDLVNVAKRENNAKRNYLVVNPLQGKHVPASPIAALKLFASLAGELKGKYEGERLLLIGFAETATAIGAQIAISLGTPYIQTTREVIPQTGYLFFSEEHSHATEQKLVKEDMDEAVKNTDRIIFIEDEVTTGKTILNIISVMQNVYHNDMKFAVASILNGMSAKHREEYEEKSIDLHYLVKTDHSKYGDIAEGFAGNGKYVDCSCGAAIGQAAVLSVAGKMDARRLVNAVEYDMACRNLFEQIYEQFPRTANDRILVVGTEEFMYPALYVASCMETLGNEVTYHATTRSPIVVSTEMEYPLHARYQLRSLYDAERKTFLYDIGAYDKVLVVTDAQCPEDKGQTNKAAQCPEDKGQTNKAAQCPEDKGLCSLIHALSIKNSDITVVRWC